jgi:hypothetical protein
MWRRDSRTGWRLSRVMECEDFGERAEAVGRRVNGDWRGEWRAWRDDLRLV